MEARQVEFLNQLHKYTKLQQNERVIIVDEKMIRLNAEYFKVKSWDGKYQILRENNFDYGTTTYHYKITCEKRLLKLLKMKWDRSIETNSFRANSITLQDMALFRTALEKYTSIVNCILDGRGSEGFLIKTNDILEKLISISRPKFLKAIEYRKEGYVPVNIGDVLGELSTYHVVTIIDEGEYLKIKEIYIPYSGIVIQLPNN